MIEGLFWVRQLVKCLFFVIFCMCAVQLRSEEIVIPMYLYSVTFFKMMLLNPYGKLRIDFFFYIYIDTVLSGLIIIDQSRHHCAVRFSALFNLIWSSTVFTSW